MYITHYIPEIIKEESWKALSFYPELSETPIHIKFVEDTSKPLLHVSPYWTNLLPWKRKHIYTICINETFTVSNTTFFTTEIPQEVIIGLLGHALGTITYLTSLSKKDILQHKLYHYFSKHYRKEVSQISSSYVTKKGLTSYVSKMRHFILENTMLSPSQKLILDKLHSSPQEMIYSVNYMSQQKNKLSLPS